MSSTTQKKKPVEVRDEETDIRTTVHEFADIELVEGKQSKKGILLRPQPSNDPNDPLVSASSEASCQYSRIY
jgi:hypothetical protein